MAYNDVGPGYFRTMKTAILQGREFYDTERDRGVCVLNQSAAAYLFPHQGAIGQYVRSTPGATANPAGRGVLPQNVICRVIGLAQDAKFANLQDAPPRTVYFPVTLETITGAGNLVFLMNAPTKAQAIAAYRAAKSDLSPATPFVVFVTLREQMEAAPRKLWRCCANGVAWLRCCTKPQVSMTFSSTATARRLLICTSAESVHRN